MANGTICHWRCSLRLLTICALLLHHLVWHTKLLHGLLHRLHHHSCAHWRPLLRYSACIPWPTPSTHVWLLLMHLLLHLLCILLLSILLLLLLRILLLLKLLLLLEVLLLLPLLLHMLWRGCRSHATWGVPRLLLVLLLIPWCRRLQRHGLQLPSCSMRSKPRRWLLPTPEPSSAPSTPASPPTLTPCAVPTKPASPTPSAPAAPPPCFCSCCCSCCCKHTGIGARIMLALCESL